jgi:hypothetical protein
LLAGPTQVRDLFIEGRRVVASGQITSIDLSKTIARQNAMALALSDG